MGEYAIRSTALAGFMHSGPEVRPAMIKGDGLYPGGNERLPNGDSVTMVIDGDERESKDDGQEEAGGCDGKACRIGPFCL